MSRLVRSMLRGRRHTLVAAAVTASLGTALLPSVPAASAADTAGTADATAATGAASPCPDPFPVGELADGAPVHGLTVSKGTTPGVFTGEVVGVLPNGIGAGLDMVMVKLRGAPITDADGKADAGIWAGMSGSPVYAEDGRLIGAVSYGLSASPSEYAGVTPAAAMYDLRRYDARTGAGTRRVRITPRAASQLRRAGLSSVRTQAGFRRLPLATSISGLNAERLDAVSERLGLSGRLQTGSSAEASDVPAPIVPGGNIAMAQSYGDVTSAAVGTTTAVCGDSVFAFGHPFAYSGRATASMHGADAVHVQRDSTFGSFKVANPSAPVGTFSQDRLAGILGRLGSVPASTPVTSTITSAEGNKRTATTHVVDQSAIGDLATIHLMSNLDSVFNGWAPGTGTMSWDITVRRANGKRVTLHHSDVFSSAYDLTFEMPWEFYAQLSAITGNPFEQVDVVGIRQHASLSPRFRQHELVAVQVRRNHRWVTQRNGAVVPSRAGRILRVRALLEPVAGSTVRRQTAHFRVRVPRSARGRVGMFSVQGGPGAEAMGLGAASFGDLVDTMAHAPKGNSVVARFRLRTAHGPHRVQRRVDRPAPVVGSRFFGVAVR